MKKTLFFLVFSCIMLLLRFTEVKAQYVSLSDPNFTSFLVQHYPSCMNIFEMDTTCSEIVNEDSLIIPSSFVASINGIQYFDNLVYLKCNSNAITSISVLPSTLQYLYCDSNLITSLPPLPDSLKVLSCVWNDLDNLPTLPSSLKILNCDNNGINNLPILPNSLLEIRCSHNDLDDLPQLPNSLKILECYFNSPFSLPVLPNALVSLVASNCLLSNLPVLPDSLQFIECSFNNLTSLPTLPNNLKVIKAYYNEISNLPNLPNSLNSLIVSNNQLLSLPALPNSLIFLECGGNSISNLPTLPDSLKVLECSQNDLINLPPLPDSLQVLACGYNDITFIPKVPSIMEIFNIGFNNITCINNLPQVTTSGSQYSYIGQNPFTCVPNQTSYSMGLPLCLDNDTANNPNNCSCIVNISGYVFSDQNNNCTHQMNDLGSSNLPVKLYDSLNVLIEQNYTTNGKYGFLVNQPGNYKVILESNNLPIDIVCSQTDTQIVNLVSMTSLISNINFPLTCDTTSDFTIHAVSQQGWVFPGQIHTLNTNIINNGSWYNLDCNSPNNSIVITIQLTGPVTYVSPANGALIPQINGNTFTYNVFDFNSLTPLSFGLRFMTDSLSQAGTPICIHVSILPAPLDGDTTNNQYDFCYDIANSYDPNMKEVYPVNVLPGYSDWFTYTIHFQNTGNAPAFNIRLRDTLDTNLNLNTFEVLGYSHAAATTLTGNILSVKFNNIMLPDSTTDYEGSMGYFQYRLKPLTNLPAGTQLENTAYIYFDYNAPIVTNTTQNNFDYILETKELKRSEGEFRIYPNPSSGVFTFKESKNLKTLEVFNLLGELVLSQGNVKQFNLSDFPKGIYVARINGQFVTKLVKE